MRAEQPDVVMFLGDYIYEYPNAARPVRPGQGNWVISLDDYRRRYALYKSDPDLRAMHAACPWLVTWDDHEVQNDYAGLHRGEGGPVVADFAAGLKRDDVEGTQPHADDELRQLRAKAADDRAE